MIGGLRGEIRWILLTFCIVYTASLHLPVLERDSGLPNRHETRWWIRNNSNPTWTGCLGICFLVHLNCPSPIFRSSGDGGQPAGPGLIFGGRWSAGRKMHWCWKKRRSTRRKHGGRLDGQVGRISKCLALKKRKRSVKFLLKKKKTFSLLSQKFYRKIKNKTRALLRHPLLEEKGDWETKTSKLNSRSISDASAMRVSSGLLILFKSSRSKSMTFLLLCKVTACSAI